MMNFVNRLFLLFSCLASVACAELGYAVPTDGDGPFPTIIFVADDAEIEMSQAAKISEGWNFVGVSAGLNSSTPEDIVAIVADVKNMTEVDESNIAIFAYGMAGTSVMSYALGGHGNDEVNAIVSFHAEISGDWIPDPIANVTPKLLILSGGEDDTSQEVMDLEVLLDSANAHWEITRYSGAEQGYTISNSSQYNEWADSRAWSSAHVFVKEAFGLTMYEGAQPNSASTVAVDYIDSIDDASLTGWLAMPESKWERPLPAVVILPDWDGVNQYEKERATALAELGYVAFAADIFGSDKQYVESFAERGELVGKFRSNPILYMSRIQSAIDQVKMMGDVMQEEIAIIGYCFGGTGVVVYALNNGTDAKAAVAFHGSYGGVFEVVQASIKPYLLILSGGDDSAHGNQTLMENAFKSGDTEWEITRYAGIGHGFTSFTSPAYDVVADARSWSSFLELMQRSMPIPSPTGTTEPLSDSPSMSPSETIPPNETTSSDEPNIPIETSADESDAPTSAPTVPSDDSAASGIGMALALFVALAGSFFF